jgi:hypothetical protein
MNCTMAVVNKVSAYVKDKTRDLVDIRAELNAAVIDNPAPQVNVKPPLTFVALAAVIAPVSLGKVMQYAHLDVIVNDLRRGDYDAASLWVQGLTAAGILTVNDATVIQADIEAENGVIHVIDRVLIPAA